MIGVVCGSMLIVKTFLKISIKLLKFFRPLFTTAAIMTVIVALNTSLVNGSNLKIYPRSMKESQILLNNLLYQVNTKKAFSDQ